MPTYPIRFPRKSPGGTNAKKQLQAQTWNAVAEKLERHINGLEATQTREALPLFTGALAAEVAAPTDLVQEILFSVDGGSGGITMVKEAS